MRKAAILMPALCFALLPVASAALARASTPSPAPSASASPAASASPDVLDEQITDLNGTPLTLRDLSMLLTGLVMVYTPPKAPHPSSILVTKPQSEMPAYDPDWHYVSSTMKDGYPVITIWVSDRLGGKAPFSLMETTALLGLLDSGFGGADWQKIYAYSLARDKAQGPNAADPYKNRREMSARAAALLNALMETLKH